MSPTDHQTTSIQLSSLPSESLAVICSFICDDPTLVYSFLTTNTDWFYNLYSDENSIVWSEMIHCRSNRDEFLSEKKQNQSYRDFIYSLWNDLYGGKSSLVFANDENSNDKSGLLVKLDSEMADLFNNNGTVDGGGFTVEMWINFHQHSFFPVMCCMTNQNWDNGFGLFEYTHNGSGEYEMPSTINMFVKDWYHDPSYSLTTTLPPVKEWHHFAGVFSFANQNTLKMFVDGKLSSSKTISDPSDFYISDDMMLMIGFSNYMGQYSYHVVGEFNDVRVWNVARSDQQIQDCFKKRFSKIAFNSNRECEGLVFNFYPSKGDDRNCIRNKSPNAQFRMEKYNASNESYNIQPPNKNYATNTK